MARSPGLTNDEVARIIKNSARDIATPGVDQYTGYGLVDARAALAASKDFFIEVAVEGVEVIQDDSGLAVQVNGTADADDFRRAWIEVGAGEEPASWKRVISRIREPVDAGILGQIPANEFQGAPVWFIRLTVEHRNGATREARFRLTLG